MNSIATSTANHIVDVGPIAARPGEIAKGFIRIGETTTGPVQIPVMVINGAAEGPVLCLTAGVHATEYAPIEAAFRLIRELTPRALRGTVIAVPIVSMHMFESRSAFVSPLDGLNLNKIAPGAAGGSISELLAQKLLNEVIGKAQYFIDLHAGDFGESLWAYAGCCLSDDPALDLEAEALCRLFTPQLISLAKGDGKLPPYPASMVDAATRRGIVSIQTESGGSGTLREEDVQVHVRGVKNIMRYLGMIEGSPEVAARHIVGTERTLVRATRAGLLRVSISPGDTLAEGQQIAEICDAFGEVVEVVRVPSAGIAGLVWTHKAVNSGDPIIRYWHTKMAPEFPKTDQYRAAG